MDSQGYVVFSEEWLHTMVKDLEELEGLLAKIVATGAVPENDLAYIRDNFRQARWPAAREVVIKRARLLAVQQSYEEMVRAVAKMSDAQTYEAREEAVQSLKQEAMNLHSALLSDSTLSPDAAFADERINKS